MPILAYGLNHRTADIAIRERLAFPRTNLERAIRDIHQAFPSIREVVIVSTCNRTEFHCEADPSAPAQISDWLARDRGVSVATIRQVCYELWDLDAVRHCMGVAAGLDSLVLGEPQILGQLKSAYGCARSCGTVGPRLERLADCIWSVAKRVRTQTDIGKNSVSVASSAVTLAQQIFDNMESVQVLLIGAGDTIRRVAQHLKQAGCTNLSIANRTFETAVQVSKMVGATPVPLAEIDTHLSRFDAIISSTGSTEPFLYKRQVQYALAKRRRRPVLIVDIAVPRDIDPAVAELNDVFLYSVDDLSQIIDTNVNNRELAAENASGLIEEAVSAHHTAERIEEANGLLSRYRQQTDKTRETLLKHALSGLRSGQDPEAVLERFSRDLTNKLVHRPTMVIRQASADREHRLLDLLEAIHTRD